MKQSNKALRLYNRIYIPYRPLIASIIIALIAIQLCSCQMEVMHAPARQTTSYDTATTQTDFPLKESGDKFYQTFHWSYLGKEYEKTFYIPKCVYNHYHALPKELPYQCFVEEDISNPYLRSFAIYFDSMAQENSFTTRQTAEFVLAFCQEIPYYDDPDVGYDWIRWPCETLFEYRQDCEDISILYVSILSNMNQTYWTCLVLMPDSRHMAAGVVVPADSDYYYMGSTGRYSFAECTHDKWKLGQLSVTQDSAIIYEIPPANKKLYEKLGRYDPSIKYSSIIEL